tara:strand:- start:2833 stop:3975 length:1143 start_codon:yes stop_codon:yes gene_type:complete
MGFKVGGTTIVDNSGNIAATVGDIDGRDIASDGTKLDTIEQNADVTDVTNVTAAGALMLTGGTMTGSLVLDANPSVNLGAATKQYVDTEVAGIVDSAPATLDTLNELAAALGDDPNFATTTSNSIGTKLPLAGGTMTGNIVMSGTETVDGRDLSVDGAKLDGIAAGATNTSAPHYTSAIGSSDVTTALGFTPYGPDATAQFDSVELGDTAGPILSQERDQNMKLQGSSGSDCGITLWSSDGSWDGQLYASGGTQGFLTSNWGAWGAYVDTSGNWTALGNVSAYSDEKLKDNIVTIENPIEKVKAIRGVTYNRNDIEDRPRQTGVVAQEVEKVLPEVVQTNDEGTKTVAYGNMVGLLIEAIKEQQAEIDKLKSHIKECNHG